MTIFRRGSSRPMILIDRARFYEVQPALSSSRIRAKGSGENDGGGNSAPASAAIPHRAEPASERGRSDRRSPPESAPPCAPELTSGCARTTSEADFLAGVSHHWVPLLARITNIDKYGKSMVT